MRIVKILPVSIFNVSDIFTDIGFMKKIVMVIQLEKHIGIA